MPTTRYWLARAANNQMTVTVAVTGYDVTTTYSVTIGLKSISVLGVTSTAGTAAALQLALSTSNEPEFREVSWTVLSSTITGVAVNFGKPFTATSSVSGGAGTIGSVTVTVASLSASDAANASNWGDASGTAGLPVTGDSIVFENSAVPCLYNVDAFAAVDIVNCTVRSTMTAGIGLHTQDDNGYWQYRPVYFQMQTCTTLYIEPATSLGAEDLKFDVGANACTMTVVGSGASQIGDEVIWWKGTNASNAVNSDGGSIAIGSLISDTADVATVNAISSAIRCGKGVAAITTINLSGSALDVQSNLTTLLVDGNSSAVVRQAATVTTLTVNSGGVTYLSSGTITTLLLLAPGSIDFSQDRHARTITNKVNMHEGCTFSDPNATVTLTAGYTVVGGRPANCNLDFGVGRTTYTVA